MNVVLFKRSKVSRSAGTRRQHRESREAQKCWQKRSKSPHLHFWSFVVVPFLHIAAFLFLRFSLLWVQLFFYFITSSIYFFLFFPLFKISVKSLSKYYESAVIECIRDSQTDRGPVCPFGARCGNNETKQIQTELILQQEEAYRSFSVYSKMLHIFCKSGVVSAISSTIIYRNSNIRASDFK